MTAKNIYLYICTSRLLAEKMNNFGLAKKKKGFGMNNL